MNPLSSRALVALLALAPLACAHKEPSGGSAAPQASATPEPEESAAAETEPAASAAPAPAAELTGCEKTLADFDKALAEATYSCTKDKDCECFDTALSQKPGNECGGVVDGPTGKKLAKIAKQAKKDGCANSASCEPWTCAPICDEGRCQKGPRKKK
jgi:hypothetical protein